MTVKLQFEIRSSYQFEQVHIDSRTKDGAVLPPIDFEKRFYRAEYEGEGCLLRFAREAKNPDVSLKRGDICEASVTSFASQGDVANFTISSLHKVKG